MKIQANSPDNYINQLPDDKRQVVKKLRKVILDNLPKGFEEVMSYGMIGYVVPHSIYPDGYHCNTDLPLPFMNLALQKNHIAVYHMGIYSDNALMNWFMNEYPKHSETRPDIGKSCIRFKKAEHIPFGLIGELAGKMTPQQWIKKYESAFKR